MAKATLPTTSWLEEEYSPERRVVVLSVELAEEIGYAAKFTKFLQDHGVSPLSYIVQAHPGRGSVHATIFLDVTESKLPIGPLLDAIRRVEYVKRAELIDIPLTHGEARLVAFTIRDLNALFKMLHDDLGAAGRAIMYHMGHRAGSLLATRVKSVFPSRVRALNYMLLYYESMGLGRFRLEEYIDGRSCRVLASELVECTEVPKEGPCSFLFRGMLAGFLTTLWGKRVEVTEIRCVPLNRVTCEYEAVAK